MGVFIRWTGMDHWNTGMEYWNGILEWTTGMDHWNTGMEYWNGLRTGMMDYWKGQHIMYFTSVEPA